MNKLNFFDYKNQAYVVNGVYRKCGHPHTCKCFGKLNEGKAPTQQIVDMYGNEPALVI
jgi:hypothetical protein